VTSDDRTPVTADTGAGGQDVVFRTGAGSKLSAVEVGHYVGFEADCYDQLTGTGWSVVVNGLAATPPGQE
jgi:hypothetical protein